MHIERFGEILVTPTHNSTHKNQILLANENLS